MRILNILVSGGTGGIERLCQNIVLNSKEDNRVCCLLAEGEIYDNLKQKGVKTISTIDCKKNIFKITNRLVDYCKKEKIEIIIVHHGGLFCNIIYLMLIIKLKNIKFVRYLHGCFDDYLFGNDSKFLKKKIIKKVMNRALRKSDLIIYISKAVKNSFEKNFNLKDKKSVVIYNGIPNKFFETPNNRKENKNFHIGYIGRLEKIKGVDILIKTFKKIIEENINAFLTIVGEGTESENLKKLVNDLELDNYVSFLGRKDDIIPILDKIDIFVYPSICDEGLGISIIESMSRGCIAVGFNKGGIPELIEEGTTGFISNKIEIDELKETIQKAINSLNTNEGIKIRKSAREFAQKFNIDNTIYQINEELKKLK